MNDADYDAIVIGSGAGGAAAAYRLVLGGMRVLLLEKGAHLPADGSTLDIRRVVHAGEFLSREPWTDGRGVSLCPEEHFNVGGKTKWYGAALLRFGAHEFGPDASHDCRGWPIAASDLAPYYDEAERLLRVRTFDCEQDLARIVARLQASKSGWRSSPMPLGLVADICAQPLEASHFDGFASAQMLKSEAETSLLCALRGNSRFELLTHAEVQGLVGDPGFPIAVRGVRLRDGRIFRGRSVLLAAGALHSPRLLLRYLSETGLDALLPSAAFVGRYLKLHLLTAMVAISAGVKRDLLRKTLVMLNERFPHSSVQPLGFDGDLISTLMPRLMPEPLRRAAGRRAYGFFLQTEDGSHFSNRVCDATPPVLDYREGRLPSAAREHHKLTRALQMALLGAGLVSFTKRIGLNGTAHACGSLVCGSSPHDSVVDPSGQVHGLQGLYVVDGSVLPRSSRVNPSLTIYAWGLRVAALLARNLQSEQTASGDANKVVAYVR